MCVCVCVWVRGCVTLSPACAGALAFAQCLLSTASADPSMLAAAPPDFDDPSAAPRLGLHSQL